MKVKNVSETRDQWGKFVGILMLLAVGGWLASKFSVLGGITNLVIVSVFLAPVGIYGDKIRRYFANVRYRVGKLQKTGDGGEDCWTTLVDKEWIPFMKYPLDHVRKPFIGIEITIDCGGYSPGSVRYNERPLTVLSEHEKFVVSIGSCDKADYQAEDEWNRVSALGTLSGINIESCVENGIRYSDLSMKGRNYINKRDFYTLMGLYILARDGLDISLSD